MDKKKLTADLIPDPRLWRLAMAIDFDSLSVMACSIVGEPASVACVIPLESDPSEAVKLLEDTIYDNPLLLQDFDRVDVILRSHSFFITPSAVDDDTLTAVARHQFGSSGKEFIINPLPNQNATFVTAADAKLIGFLRRSFFNMRLMNWHYPLCQFFGEKNRSGNSKTMWANIFHQRIDIVALNGGSLRMANTFDCLNENDALYYIMASMKNLDFDPKTDSVTLTGDTEIRKKLASLLREYVANVLPAILPSSVVGALDNSAASRPIPLLLSQICE